MFVSKTLLSRLLLLSASSLVVGSPQPSETATSPAALITKPIASYQVHFANWASSLVHNPRISPRVEPELVARQHTKCNWQCSSPCPCRLLVKRDDEVEMATWSDKSTFTTPAITPLPSATKAMTMTEGPLRTVILPGASNQQVVPSNHDNNDEIYGANIRPSTDQTSDFYAFPLSGQHPAVLPLITVPHNSSTPLTLLAYANTTMYSSFISSTLVAALNLSHTITTPVPVSPLSFENDLTSLLGYKTAPVGVVNLNILAGQADRMATEWPFTVFDAPAGEDEWRVDLWIGWTFLNHVEALKLTEEYTGGREAGACHGIGVLVQRVYEGI